MTDLDFLIPGRECLCDGTTDGLGRCDNHDDEAEEAYWKGEYDAAHRTHVIEGGVR